MSHELTPEQIANICISAGFNDYEPHIYDTIRIGKAIERAIEAENAISAALYEALDDLVNRYAGMINSGDCGFWDPETETEVIKARAALRKARGET